MQKLIYYHPNYNTYLELKQYIELPFSSNGTIDIVKYSVHIDNYLQSLKTVKALPEIWGELQEEELNSFMLLLEVDPIKLRPYFFCSMQNFKQKLMSIECENAIAINPVSYVMDKEGVKSRYAFSNVEEKRAIHLV